MKHRFAFAIRSSELSARHIESPRSRSLSSVVVLLVGYLLWSPPSEARWEARPEVVAAAEGIDLETVSGIVFDDRNSDGRRQADEPGVQGVLVTNGLDVVATDDEGRYQLTARGDMNLTVVQPSGWVVPVDRRQVPQFFHVHKREGSPGTLRFGGLPEMGPSPEQVNFPLRRSPVGDEFTCAIIGDSQTYSHAEVGFFRDSTITDLLAAGPDAWDCMLYLGDVVGDDLGLLDRLLEVGAAVGVPQWLTHGNHDYDFDATDDADSADSWRRLYGPEYYAFELGQVLFIVLDNVVYPCDEADMVRPGREFCADPENKRYNGRINDTQMRWLENLLELVPSDRLIVVATHIPLASFMDPTTIPHQTDNASELYALLEGRPALSLSGHTHTLENHAPGQSFAGWPDAVGIERLPFRHIVAGAASGSWWQGDFDIDGIPMALQRQGAPKGVLELRFDGTAYREHYLGARLGRDRIQWLELNTPAFREWFNEILSWALSVPEERDPVPPRSINDLPDTRLLSPADLAEGTWLTANVWLGSAETNVTAALNDGPAVALQRTQQGDGEAVRIGAEWADPFAAQRQLSVTRFALQSRSGEARNQGFEVFRGSRFGPAPPQPMRSLADRNMHLWRLKLPESLPAGVHRYRVETVDRHGRLSVEHFAFEVREQLPPLRWRQELWD